MTDDHRDSAAPAPVPPAEDPEQFLVSGDRVTLRREGDGNVTVAVDGRSQPLGGVASAFPLTRRNRMVALRDLDGQEIAILEHARQLDDESRRLLREAMDRAYFMPRVTDIRSIEEELNVVQWDVVTNRGDRVFQVRGIRRNVRRIGERRLVIKDVDGNRYEVRDWMVLPDQAQKLIQPYL
jgi:hypothetical protein